MQRLTAEQRQPGNDQVHPEWRDGSDIRQPSLRTGKGKKGRERHGKYQLNLLLTDCLVQPNFEDRTQSPSDAGRTPHEDESSTQLRKKFVQNNPYSSVRSSINSKISLSSSQMRLKDFKVQDTDQYDLRRSNKYLPGSQGDMQSSLLSPQLNREVNGTTSTMERLSSLACS